MPIASEELPRHLASGLKPLYVVYGDAPLLAMEAADSIRAAARAAGYSERETFVAEQHFKWAELRNSAQTLSLFADRKVIDLRIPSGKPGVEGGQALQDYVANLSPDIVTLIWLPKLDWATQKTQWFGALERHGVMVSADDIPRSALPRWIAARLKRQDQNADEATLEFLADRCEGNLLAAFQEIQKLALLFPVGQLSFEQVRDAVMDVARYDLQAFRSNAERRYSAFCAHPRRAAGRGNGHCSRTLGGQRRYPHAGQGVASRTARRQSG